MWGQDASGHSLGHFALSVRLQEFAHLGQLYLDDLVLNGRPTVSDDWFDMVSKPHAAFQEPRENPAIGRISEGYTFQFWLPLNYDEEFMASGAFGQYLWIDRKRNFVVAQFSTAGARPKETAAVMRALGQYALDHKPPWNPNKP
jgi:CubicO group peptidase (beta-lactamase class C family)